MSNRVNSYKIVSCPADKEQEVQDTLFNLVHVAFLKDTTILKELEKFNAVKGIEVILDADYGPITFKTE